MKKMFVFLIILFVPIIMYAKEYEAPIINSKLEVNENYIVLTRDNLDNNSDLVKLNITKETMTELMNKNNIYYDIIKNDISYEILVIVPNVTIDGWNNFTNATDKILDDMRSAYAKQVGANVSSVYKNTNNYIVVEHFDEKTEYYIVNYYTVVNNKGYNVQLQKKSEITDEEKRELKEIVDSLEIKVLDEYKNETPDTQKKIDNYGKKKSSFDYMRIIYGAIIGATAGIISYIIGVFIRKKSSN